MSQKAKGQEGGFLPSSAGRRYNNIDHMDKNFIAAQSFR